MKIKNNPDSAQLIIGPALAVDTLIFTIREGKLSVLLIKISSGPYQGKWALPGGIVPINETLDEAARNILEKKAGLQGVYMEQLYTFSDVKRDVRGRMVSVAYFALVDSDKFALKTMDYYTDIQWKELDHLPRMAFDHKEIIQYGFARLQAKIEYTNIAYGLLPAEFTLSELQAVYEIILERALDKRNFRKKILALGIVQTAKGLRRGGVSRPAQLYRFTQRSLMLAQIL
jgi:8-oxo-dGTP diphosphatase